MKDKFRNKLSVSNIFLTVSKYFFVSKAQWATFKVIFYCFRTWFSATWSAAFLSMVTS